MGTAIPEPPLLLLALLWLALLWLDVPRSRTDMAAAAAVGARPADADRSGAATAVGVVAALRQWVEWLRRALLTPLLSLFPAAGCVVPWSARRWSVSVSVCVRVTAGRTAATRQSSPPADATIDAKAQPQRTEQQRRWSSRARITSRPNPQRHRPHHCSRLRARRPVRIVPLGGFFPSPCSGHNHEHAVQRRGHGALHARAARG